MTAFRDTMLISATVEPHAANLKEVLLILPKDLKL